MNAGLVHVRCALCNADDPREELRFVQLGLADRSQLNWRIVRCGSCGLVYVDPRLEVSAQELYAKDDYGFERSVLADWFTDVRSHADRVLDDVGEPHGGRLLDVGAATGDLLVAARARGWRVAGVEISPYAAGTARERGLQVHVGTLEDAAFASGSFDVITLLDVIEHVSDPIGMLREIRRLLAPGGRVVIETPNWGSIYRKILRRRWAALQPRVHILYFDRTTLTRAVRAAGFESVSARTEIVALFSPEAARRGLGPGWFLGTTRDLLVRWRFRQRPGRIDQFLSRIGPARRAIPGAGSFKEASLRTTRPAPRRAPAWAFVVRAMNHPIDRVLNEHDFGEQLRLVGRA